MSENVCKCDCNCAENRKAQFAELQPVLDQYAKVPGSLITILQKAQDIYGYLSYHKLHIRSYGHQACKNLRCGYFLCTVQTAADRQVFDHALPGYCMSR